MPDVLSSTSREIEKRLAQLRPIVEEFERLIAAEAALAGIHGTTPAPRRRGPGRPKGRNTRTTTAAATKAAAKPAVKPAKAPARKPAKRRAAGRPKGTGGRAAQALQLVQAQPGITIPELAQAMGIKQNYLYRVMPGLQKERKVTKKGKGWHPA